MTKLDMPFLPKISIVIPAYNSNKQAKLTVEKLVNQKVGLQFEVILVDDGSKSAIKFDVITQSNVYFTIINCSVNKGRSSAINEGIKFARGEYIGFLDVDCEPVDNYLSSIAKDIDAGRDIIFGHLVFKSSPFFEKFENEVQYKRLIHIENWASELTTACVVIKRELINKVGGFNESFNRYGFEDRDFFLRLTNLCDGLQVVYNKKAIVIHEDQYELNKVLKKIQSSGDSSSKVFYKFHPIVYKEMAYFKVDWRNNPYLHWIPRVFIYMIIKSIRIPITIIFNASTNYQLKKHCYKALKGLFYLKGTMSLENKDA